MRLFFSALISFALIASPAPAQNLICQKSICFEPSKKLAGSEIPIKGVELLTYFKFKLYTAALYAPTNVNSIDAVLNDIPKSLILHYHRTIKKEWMIKASRDRIQKNPDNNLSLLETRLIQLDHAYKTVQKDDRYELRYEPSVGTSLILNNQIQAIIPGKDFQRAFFGIWLSKLPVNKQLRDRLIHPDKH